MPAALNDDARAILDDAQTEARAHDAELILVEHIAVCLALGDNLAGTIFDILHVDRVDLVEHLRDAAATRSPPMDDPPERPPMSPAARTVMELTIREALQLGHHEINAGHLLLAVLRHGATTAAVLLHERDVKIGWVRQELIGQMERAPKRLAEEAAARAETPARWHHHAHDEWSLRAGTPPASRILMRRTCDDDGLGTRGEQVAWRDIANFDSHHDAEHVLRLLREASA